MSHRIGFWTPVKYDHQPVAFGRKLTAFSDDYFHLNGRVAIAVPESLKNGSVGVKLESRQTKNWQTILKVVSYATIIFPLIMFIIKAVGRCYYSFHIYEPDASKYQNKVKNIIDKTIQKKPTNLRDVEELAQEKEKPIEAPKLKVLLGEVPIPEKKIQLNFAEVMINGRQELIPVQAPHEMFDRDPVYVPYTNGSACEALSKMAQDNQRRFMYEGGLHYGSPVKFVLEHPNNHRITTEEFLTYLITPDQEGGCPIHKVNSGSLLEILQLAKKTGIIIDLAAIDLATGETLFSKWAASGDWAITKALLEYDPPAIHQVKGKEVSILEKVLLQGTVKAVTALLQAIRSQNVELSDTDQWLCKAFTGECNFSKEEFLSLPEALQKKVSQVANTYIQNEFVRKLRNCGMMREPVPPTGMDIVSYNMDAIDVENSIDRFLSDLRKEGKLLSQDEFNALDQRKYVKKGAQVERILGRDYLERNAKEMGLPFIKVPKKIAVIIPKDQQSPDVHVDVSLGHAFGLRSSDLMIYAEKIQPIERKATREEMSGLLDLVEKVCYYDFLEDNLMMGKNEAGEEGIYFIDTEENSFSNLPFQSNMTPLGNLMAPLDHEWLEKEMSERYSRFEATEEERKKAINEAWKAEKSVAIECGFRRYKPFLFNIADLLNQKKLGLAANE